MRFDLIKCHGSGNDFPLIDARASTLGDAAWAAVARALADRDGPVGGDGLLLLTGGDDTHAFGMRMFNSDGSESETCLNGLRCVARAGFAATGLETATALLKTSDAAVVRDADIAEGVFTVREIAGPASLDVAAWPMHVGTDRILDTPIAPLPTDRAFTAVAMPNPHLVTFVDAIDEGELVRVGEACEAAPDWLPNRANVSFVEVRGHDLFVRTFERGVGLTDSCGSAMAASVFAAALTGRVPFGAAVTVFNKGGRVRGTAEDGGGVTISGNATFLYDAAIDVDIAAGTAGMPSHVALREDEARAWDAAIN